LKGNLMADSSSLAGLLDRAGNVFLLASQLGRAFHDERGSAGGLRQIDPEGWDRHQPAFSAFCDAVLELRDAIQNPPNGFAPVAEALRRTALVAKQIRDAMQTANGRAFATYLDFFPELNSAAASGREAIGKVTDVQQLDDPFAFLDQSAIGKDPDIDTTPTLPRPSHSLIEAAARAVPYMLANLQPEHDGPIELVASDLAKRLQDAKHTLAAAHWAIHGAIRMGWLRTGRVQTVSPSFGRRVGQRASFGRPDTRRWEWTGGEVRTIAIPEGKPAPFDSFKVVATESLWTWWRALETATSPYDLTATGLRQLVEQSTTNPPVESSDPPPKAKRGTERGEARVKLIAALTKHHQYADGSCLTLEPIGNNELARQAKVSESTASAFFNEEFKGHKHYKILCRDLAGLSSGLKLLNNEFAPHNLYGRRPPYEDDRDDE
jgi:hypothetical protein